MAAKRARKKAVKKAPVRVRKAAGPKKKKAVSKAKVRRAPAKKAAKRPAAARPTAKRRAVPKRAPATRGLVLEKGDKLRRTALNGQDKPAGPPPPPEDAVEVSGIYERVMFSESDPYQEVREIFGHYDRDKSGTIEASEFARICQALGVEMDEEELQVGLSIVDADGDGKISWDEFLGWWRSR